MKRFNRSHVITVYIILLSFLSFSIAKDSWFSAPTRQEIETRMEQDRPKEEDPQIENQEALFESIIRKQVNEGKDIISNPVVLPGQKLTEPTEKVSSPFQHILLEAFDKDGDGLLDENELKQLHGDSWVKFHSKMGGKVLGALGALRPQIAEIKRSMRGQPKNAATDPSWKMATEQREEVDPSIHHKNLNRRLRESIMDTLQNGEQAEIERGNAEHDAKSGTGQNSHHILHQLISQHTQHLAKTHQLN